jgi:DNA-directed RNA polymerase alpha subunit
MGSWSVYSKMPLTQLGLSTRTVNALLRTGYRTVGDAASLNIRELLDIPGMGIESARNLMERMNDPDVLLEERVKTLEDEVRRLRELIDPDVLERQDNEPH